MTRQSYAFPGVDVAAELLMEDQFHHMGDDAPEVPFHILEQQINESIPWDRRYM